MILIAAVIGGWLVGGFLLAWFTGTAIHCYGLKP